VLEDRVTPASTRLAIIGDYGTGNSAEAAVASRVRSLQPQFIVTAGDNNYPSGAASTIDRTIGKFYHSFIAPYHGSFGAGAATNEFFPALGNHDWMTAGAGPYLNYFTLPGNERYYTFRRGPVQFFVIDSDPHEPSGVTPSSKQGQWLRSQLAASTAPWKLVVFHHSPFASGDHGSAMWMRWPFHQWGATAVISGHDHFYERLWENGLPYFVDGLSGQPIVPVPFGTPIAGSQVRYNARHGALLVQATDTTINFRFITDTGVLIDNYWMIHKAAAMAPQPTMATNEKLSEAIDDRARLAILVHPPDEAREDRTSFTRGRREPEVEPAARDAFFRSVAPLEMMAVVPSMVKHAGPRNGFADEPLAVLHDMLCDGSRLPCAEREV
jgi:hypothetical protein